MYVIGLLLLVIIGYIMAYRIGNNQIQYIFRLLRMR